LLNFTQDSRICQRFLINNPDWFENMDTELLLKAYDDRAVAEPVYGYFIEIIAPEQTQSTLPLQSGREILVGRSPHHCNILLTDKRISRVHLRISCTAEQRITVTDMYTANGSLLDGRPLLPGMPMNWLINQPIIIGSAHLILRYGIQSE